MLLLAGVQRFAHYYSAGRVQSSRRFHLHTVPQCWGEIIDAHKIAVLLRGGMLPQAYVYPAEMRAIRD